MILYCTDNCLNENIMAYCQQNLKKVAGNIPIMCVAKKQTQFGDVSIHVELEERSRRAIFLQMKVGLEYAYREIQPDIIYICEHDCLYPEGYFDFEPADPFTFYYTKHKFFMDEMEFVDGSIINLSTLVCNYKLLLAHVNLRVYRIEVLKMKKGGWTNCEPAISKGDTMGRAENRDIKYPVVDIRHGGNMSNCLGERIFPEHLRDNSVQEIPYWGKHPELKEAMQWHEVSA